MTSTATPLGLNQQGDGDNANTWGDILNAQVIALVDEAIRGIYSATLSGSHTLDATNFVSNEARRAILNITGGTGGTIVTPDISKLYVVINGASGDVTVKGSGSGCVVHSGEVCHVVNDGVTVKRVVPTDFGSATLTGIAQALIANSPTLANHIATKAYADALAFASFAGTFPAMASNAGKFILTDGSTAFWGPDVTGATGKFVKFVAGAPAWTQPATTDLPDYITQTKKRAMIAALIF
jgi:hypothetical protein